MQYNFIIIFLYFYIYRIYNEISKYLIDKDSNNILYAYIISSSKSNKFIYLDLYDKNIYLEYIFRFL